MEKKAVEIKEDTSLFYNQTTGIKKTAQKLDNQYQDIYMEVPPLTYNKETGEWINETKEPVLLPNGKVNVYEKIQSNKENSDIKVIWARYQALNDPSILNEKVACYMDLTPVADNAYDMMNQQEENIKKFKKLEKPLQDALLKGTEGEEMNQLIHNAVMAEMQKQGYIKPEEKKETK